MFAGNFCAASWVGWSTWILMLRSDFFFALVGTCRNSKSKSWQLPDQPAEPKVLLHIERLDNRAKIASCSASGFHVIFGGWLFLALTLLNWALSVLLQTICGILQRALERLESKRFVRDSLWPRMASKYIEYQGGSDQIHHGRCHWCQQGRWCSCEGEPPTLEVDDPWSCTTGLPKVALLGMPECWFHCSRLGPDPHLLI